MSLRANTSRNRLSLASGAGANDSPFGLLLALLLHAGLLCAALFTWQHRLDIVDQSAPVVPVDVVTVAKETNIRATAPKVAPQPLPPVQPQPLIAPPVTPPPAAQAAQPAPVAPPQPAPVPQAEPAPQPTPVARPPAPQAVEAPPVVTPMARPAPPKKQAFNPDQIEALLNHIAPAAQPGSARAMGAVHHGIGAQTAMTADLRDALRNQIEQCWTKPTGAPHPEQLVVSFQLSLNPDGSVLGAPQLTAESASAAARDTYVRAAAEAARRAIFVCQPYKLPADRYADWRDSVVLFDPRDPAGQ
jgi:outer membrane biosynthesis protein TonB